MTTATREKDEHDAVTGKKPAAKPAEPEKAQFVKMPEPRLGDMLSINEPPGSQVLPEGGDKPEQHAKQPNEKGDEKSAPHKR